MAPTRPSRAAAKENGTAAEPVTDDGAPVKRGRGRPPKNGIAPQVKKAPSGRPRGRPPGIKKAAKPAPSKPAASSGPGRRGRPRKSDAGATTPKKATTPKSAAAKPSSTGKGRGRPRKSEASPVNEPEDEEEDDVEGKGEDDEGTLSRETRLGCDR